MACSEGLVKAIAESLSLSNDKAILLCASLASELGQPAAAPKLYDDVRAGLNTSLLLTSGALVFFMHAGFASLCAGAIRSKNTLNILLQTVLDACVSAIAFYILGFGFAYGEGDKPNKFIGNALFGLSNYSTNFSGTGNGRWTDWFFAWAFSATAATIPAGAVAERFNFNAYLGYTALLSAFVYPVVVHWVWSRHGWLNYYSAGSAAVRDQSDFLFMSGMIDFAGSGVVHLTGALAGLMGCYLVGPRLGRFDAEGRPVIMPGHSAVLSVLGTVMLWFGWYGFNPGSILALDTPAAYTVAARSAVTTTLSGAAGGASALTIGFAMHKSWDLMTLCNGVLVGFVSVTAGAHVLEPWAAMLVGALGAVLFEGACRLLLRLKIDDPLSAFPMHGVCGAWAVLYVGLLAKEEYVLEAYGQAPYYGLFYGGGGRLLACQVVGILAIVGWVCGLMGAFFLALKKFDLLRISPEAEIAGLDVSAHGGSAYNTDAGSSHHSGGFTGMNPPLRQRPVTMARGMAFYDAPRLPHATENKPAFAHVHVSVGPGVLQSMGPSALPDHTHVPTMTPLASPLVTVIEETAGSEEGSPSPPRPPVLQPPPVPPPTRAAPAIGVAAATRAVPSGTSTITGSLMTGQSNASSRDEGTSSPHTTTSQSSKTEQSQQAQDQSPQRSEDSLFSLPLPPPDNNTAPVTAPVRGLHCTSAQPASSSVAQAGFAGADVRAHVTPVQTEVRPNGDAGDGDTDGEPCADAGSSGGPSSGGGVSPVRPVLGKQWSQPLDGSPDAEAGVSLESGQKRTHELSAVRSLRRVTSSSQSPTSSPMSGVRFTHFSPSQRRA